MRGTRTLTALVLGLSLALVGCGAGEQTDTDTSPSSSGEGHNDNDVAFATDMIQHHAQALAMVDLTKDRDLDPEVEALAEDIQAAQVPEIETMVGWLRDWDEEIPATVRDHVNAASGHSEHDMGEDTGMGSDMPGMMSEEDMTALEEASDAEFQDMWLEMMIEHHEGAVEMARDEQVNGENASAIDLASRIEESQTDEIEKMNALLSQ
jgi:uncharacterized protein (DUF305 family)